VSVDSVDGCGNAARRLFDYIVCIEEMQYVMDGDTTGERREQLLIVDDQSSTREVLAIKLQREGYGVVHAESIRSAEEAVGRGGLDLVLLDVTLPDGNGVNWLLRLRGAHSALDLPVIIISGIDNTTDVVQALRNGANDYITKPFDLAVIMARVRTQLALKRLKQANDRFLRVASHDVKRPLTLMLDIARQLSAECEQGKPMDKEAITAFGLLIDAGEFMQQIIGDLLELRAIRDGRLELTKLPTDIGAICRQAVARNRPQAQNKNIELTMQFGKDLPNIRADDFRIMQVLENLIGNAVKFCPPGASVTVRSRCEDEWLVCEVSDTGPGIPAADMDKLFIEYARLQNKPTGGESSTGLGLAICREIVRLHKGEIGARNNPDKGVTFWFRLPMEKS
jgi:two-component system, sensor histidine kinase and response regulator